MIGLWELFSKLEIEYVEGCEPFFEAAISQHASHQNEIFSDSDVSVLGRYADDARAAAEELISDPDNALYAYFLASLIEADDAKILSKVCWPHKGKALVAYDLLPIFSLMWCLPRMLADHERRGIPHDVTMATVGMLENQIGDFVKLHKNVGIARFTVWLTGFLNSRIIRVGRFNIEIRKFAQKYRILRHGSTVLPISDGNTFHSSGRVLGSVGCEDDAGAYTPTFSECDEYYEGCACDGEFCTKEVKKYYKADGWRLALSSDDTVISVHIPSGGPIDPDTVRRDLVRAGEIVRNSYGHFSAYYCSSWLLDPAILRATGKESNITRFASLFTRYPNKSDGSAVFIYVWGMSPDTDPSTIPDYNSFANSLRKYLCDGGHIYGSGGVFFEI